jgi:hypothetical protein
MSNEYYPTRRTFLATSMLGTAGLATQGSLAQAAEKSNDGSSIHKSG